MEVDMALDNSSFLRSVENNFHPQPSESSSTTAIPVIEMQDLSALFAATIPNDPLVILSTNINPERVDIISVSDVMNDTHVVPVVSTELSNISPTLQETESVKFYKIEKRTVITKSPSDASEEDLGSDTTWKLMRILNGKFAIEEDDKKHLDQEESFVHRDLSTGTTVIVPRNNLAVLNDEDRRLIHRVITLRLIEIIMERQLKNPKADKTQDDKLRDHFKGREPIIHKPEVSAEKLAQREAFADELRSADIKRGIARKELERAVHEDAVKEDQEEEEYTHELDEKHDQIKQQKLKESIRIAEESQDTALARPRLKPKSII